MRQILLGCLASVLLCGCQSARFYTQAIRGEAQILTHRQSVQDLLAATNTPPELKFKLAVVMKMRIFAGEELKLPIKHQYLKYVDLHRPFAVWIVSAAPALSLEPKTWWFPVIGRASYQGYFSKKAATRYAERLEKQGWDVNVGGVETYSTLGWFHDPLLSTFLEEPEEEVADTLFHELAHQKLFIHGDTDFNETFATAVAEEGVHRWYQAQNKPEAFARFQTNHQHDVQFIQTILAVRRRLEPVYGDLKLSDIEKLRLKKQIFDDLRKEITALKTAWGGDAGLDAWLKRPINNARLTAVSTYYQLVPAFRQLLLENHLDLEKFYHAARDIGRLPPPDRQRALKALKDRASR